MFRKYIYRTIVSYVLLWQPLSVNLNERVQVIL